MLSGYWPWWAGAMALVFVSLVYFRITGRTLGVSGFVWRLVRWRSERAAERADAELSDDEEFMAALMAATADEMGMPQEPIAVPAAEPGSVELRREVPQRVPVGMAFTFLCAVALGGFAAALSTGTAGVHTDMDPLFHELFGTGWTAILVLFGAGLLIGLGTSMAGGCTSGHGLSGCANRQPGSFVTTASFFGTGIVVSFLLGSFL